MKQRNPQQKPKRAEEKGFLISTKNFLDCDHLKLS